MEDNISEPEIILKAEDVKKSYQLGKTSVPVLKGVNLDVKKNEWLAVLGASGSGKTTLLNILGTLERPDSGDVICSDISYLNMTSREKSDFRNRKIGFVFQAYHMFPELSILENVRLPAMLKKDKNANSRAADLLDQVGLSHRISHKPTELSGGEQQRAAIARALINSPDIILADEPTGNLDSTAGEQILEIFQKLHNSNLCTTIIMITHDMNVAGYAERKIILKDGITENAM